MNEISKETIDKAEELIKFITGESTLSKAKADPEPEEEEEAASTEEEKVAEKVIVKSDVSELEQLKAKNAELQAQLDEAKAGVTIKKAEADTIEKGITMNGKSIDEIVKGEIATVLETVGEKFQAVGDLYLTNKEHSDELAEEIDGIKKSLDEIKKSIEVIGNQPVSGGRAVLTANAIERFKEANGKDAEIYSLSNRVTRKALVNKLYELSNIEKGENVDEQLMKGFADVESAGGFSDPSLSARLKKDFNIHVVS